MQRKNQPCVLFYVQLRLRYNFLLSCGKSYCQFNKSKNPFLIWCWNKKGQKIIFIWFRRWNNAVPINLCCGQMVMRDRKLGSDASFCSPFFSMSSSCFCLDCLCCTTSSTLPIRGIHRAIDSHKPLHKLPIYSLIWLPVFGFQHVPTFLLLPVLHKDWLMTGLIPQPSSNPSRSSLLGLFLHLHKADSYNNYFSP